MRKNEDIYKRIYTKTLERKNELSKMNNLRTNVFPANLIETNSYLDFSKSKKNLLPSGSAVIYLYEDVLNDKTLLDRKSIVQHTVYALPDFITRTKVGILVSDETGLIDPDGISVYVTDMNTLVFMLNKNTSSYISIIYLKGIYQYTRYNNNVDVVIPASYKNSFVVWTKLDNSPSGAIDWIDPVFSGGTWKVPIRAQGKFSVLMLADNFKFYSIIPQTNSQFSYINFPDDIGYTNLNNVFLWRNRKIGFSQPIAHTPLYDGFKVEGVTRTSVTLNGSTGYANFGTIAGTNSMTLHLKVKINAFGNLSRILQRGNADGYGWSLRTTTANKLLFQFKKYDVLKNIVTDVLATNTWYDIVVTCTSDSFSPVMYINSIRQATTMIDDNAADSGTSELVMGRRANDSQSYASVDVDYFRIYNRVLVFGEILNAYNDIPSATGMTNEWLMNENTGTTLNDTKGSNNGTLAGGYTWVTGADDTAARLVGFSKRVDFTSKYADLRHQYSKYKPYMTEFLANTLPAAIKNFVPYTPAVTMDTLFADFQNKMVTASKDFPNFLKEWLEETESIKFTDYVINDINPTFTRTGAVTDVGPLYASIPANTPRYRKSTDPMKKGIIIEEAITNKMPDPLFKLPVLNTTSTTNWAVRYATETNSVTQVANNILRHTAFNNNNTSIRLNSPSFTINKAAVLTIQFKIKYIKNTGDHDLYGYGNAVGTTGSDEKYLSTYLYTSYVDPVDGFTYKEYRIPANTFVGSGITLAIGLWGAWNGYEEKDYYIKEFMVLEKPYGGYTFIEGSKELDLLKVPSPNILNLTSGTVGIWFTPEMINPISNSRLVQTNDTSLNTRFIITLMNDGSVYFAAGTSESNYRVLQSAPGLITPRVAHYVAMTWENGVLYAFVNGVQINSGGYGLANSPIVIKDFFYIGADSNGAQQLNGIVHDFRVSNVRKSASEIQAIYAAKSVLPIEASTTMKLNFDETVIPPKELTHPIKVITNHNLKNRLLFNNGLNISPMTCTYNIGTRKYTSAFRTSDIRGTKITEVDTEATYVPYYERKTIATQNVVIGPNANIDADFVFDVFEITPATETTQATMEIMNPSNYTYTINGNIVKFVFVAGKVGKDIVVCERRYNQFFAEGYSYDGLIQKLPTWVSFLPKEKMFIFLNGRLLERDRFYLFDPYRFTVMKGDTAIATDLDTNTLRGEIFNGYFTTELELVEYNVTLINGTKIFTLNNKDFPFSKKYNLIFVDGKLIHPDDIKEIDNYRFSMTTTSTNNMCIFRKRMEFANSSKFSGIKDKWTEYLESLNTTQLEALIGPMNTIVTGENNVRSVYLPERHLFEILYYYCLKDRTHLTDNDDIMIPIELPGTMLPDGRIPISTMRSGPYPRYQL